MLTKLTNFSIRFPKIIFGFWAMALVGLGVASYNVNSSFTASFAVPRSDSQAAITVLEDHFPNYGAASGILIVKADNGVQDPEVKQKVGELLVRISHVKDVKSVASPYEPEGQGQISPQGTIAFATIQFTHSAQQLPKSTTKTIADLVAETRPQASNMQLELGGQAFSTPEPPGSSEAMGLIAAMIILLIVFGSAVAMGVTLFIAISGVGIGAAIILLLSTLTDVPMGATELGAMIGLGVGIDYALFIITRYRQELLQGKNPREALVVTMNTAGRSVVFAGVTVIVSLMGMLFMDIGYVQGLGMAAAIVVVSVLAGSLTLLPAILYMLAKKIELFSIPGIKLQSARPSKYWRSWSQKIELHPWKALGAGLCIIALLAMPVFSMQLGAADASTKSETNSARRAYDLQTEGFGVGSNGPLLIVGTTKGTSDLVTFEKVRNILQSESGVASVSPVIFNQDRTAAILRVTPTTSPQDEATVALIERLREHTLPSALAGTDVVLHVGGIVAGYKDLSALVVKRLPVFISVVLLVSFLILMAVFRSILIPLKAILLNMLSVAAAYGVVVAIFQWGWLKDVFNLGATGPIESFLPLMLFAILFGLSMDYEIFLLGRIQEEYAKHKDIGKAVSTGLFKSARIITAAAAIMVAVFGSFALGDDRIIKEFGIGLAAAVIIDATVIRLLLVPASMHLFGAANWWLPRWLQWLPTIKIEK